MNMRKLFYSLPFLFFGFGLMFWWFNFIRALVVVLGLLTFALEYRYGGESRETEELVAIGISMSNLLLPVFPTFSEVLAVFIFLLEFASLLIARRLKRSISP
ncbi:hypothetical protein [Thermococcus sp.]